ncbi:MAG: hypothetical protein JW730_04900 [Anaerolineales bacterium]|nr:hypothetical protein [Anaerolineales bacterium]
MKPLTNVPKPAPVYILLVLFLAIYTGVRVLNLSQAVQKVKTTADTTSYMRISKEPIFTNKFLVGSRPFIFPLLLKVLGNNAETVVWAQGIFSIVSWSILAVALASSLHVPVLKFLGFGSILVFSLYRYILGWDSVLLTESLSLSLMALFLASWLWLIKEWSPGRVAFVLSAGLFWTFARDTNAWVVLMVALFLLLLIALRAIDWKYFILSGAFLVMFFLSNLSADFGDRWVFPFQNILGRRILPNAQATHFFAGCGMPMLTELMERAGGYANSSDRAFYEDPALADYRLWLHEAGKRCYVKWLLSAPLQSIKAPLAEFNALISLQNIQPFLFSKKFSPVLPGRLEAILFPRQGLLVVFALVSGAVLIAVLTRAWTHNKTWWLVIGMNILIFPHYFITWHGDVMGIYRHVVSASVQFYLGTWLLVLLVLDSIFSFKGLGQGLAKPLLKSVEQQRNEISDYR